MTIAEQMSPDAAVLEPARLAALHDSAALDNVAGPDFVFLTGLAARLCGVAHAYIALVDADRVWTRACVGLALESLPRDEGCCAGDVTGAALTEIPDTAADPRTATLTAAAPFVRRYASVPLRTAAGDVIGALAVLDSRPGSLAPDQREQLAGLARQVMLLIEARANEQALRQATQRLGQLTITDELTGLYNRAALLHRLKLEVARVRRFQTPLAAVMIDLDQFLQVNFDHGHVAGDGVLVAIARLVRDHIRMIDVAARYGGDELCLLLPNTSLAGARTMAEALRARIAAQVFGDGTCRVKVTASFGVAAFDHLDTGAADSLLHAAGVALEQAKSDGCNRVH